MSDLSLDARLPFFAPPGLETSATCSSHAQSLSSKMGISEIFPPHMTTLDAYSFSPCGYSANALIAWRETSESDQTPSFSGEGYYNMHVTPEDGWSYASFECNVPLPTGPSLQNGNIPDLRALIRRVVRIFQPGRLSLTLFISSEDNNNPEDEADENSVEAAQRAFKAALAAENGDKKVYRRTDKINYEFGGYDLAFASFELCS
jgi:S-adenosylmethionine decarboxylase